jgi:hypothetical protein
MSQETSEFEFHIACVRLVAAPDECRHRGHEVEHAALGDERLGTVSFAGAFACARSPPRMVEPILGSTFGPRVGLVNLSQQTTTNHVNVRWAERPELTDIVSASVVSGAREGEVSDGTRTRDLRPDRPVGSHDRRRQQATDALICRGFFQ